MYGEMTTSSEKIKVPVLQEALLSQRGRAMLRVCI